MGHWSDWINDRTVVAILAVVAWMGDRIRRYFKQAKDARESSRPARTADGKRFDPQAEERSRRVREEVARKIAQRRAASAQPPAGRPDPFRPRAPRDVPRPPEPQKVPRPFEPTDAGRPTEPAEVPRPFEPQGGGRLLEPWDMPRPAENEGALRPTEPAFKPPTLTLEDVPRRRTTTVAAVAPVTTPISLTALSKLPGAPRPLSPWAAELRDPANARRAIVLREILGPPVGFRS